MPMIDLEQACSAMCHWCHLMGHDRLTKVDAPTKYNNQWSHRVVAATEGFQACKAGPLRDLAAS